ncbi:hypothetical protein [Flavobacterium piscisymbiosum]|uniref:Tc toxin complex TcA C-terminal TcB-binding domain-containing protein n=1 Tax=Flavobacterium piscisymbiosum TaxID=2893753 RepID=A0ABS8MLJ1_9FLAO|nr:hypothetical protein [Flavobacterium sp. F-30]MCC9065821.1 hypothetical protein [Flavobacterium sp. F-30]
MLTDNTLINQSAQVVDWSSFYSKLKEKGNVPNAAITIIDKNYAVFRDMYLDLGTITESIRTSGFSPSQITIYADVLHVGDFTNVLLDAAGLIIYARRIEVTDNSTIILDYQKTNTAQVIVFAVEMAGTITVSAIKNTKDQPVLFNISQVNVSPGIIINNSEGNPVSNAIKLEQGLGFQLPGNMLLYLNNAFIYASLLYDQDPKLALSIFLWVKSWAAQSPEMEELFYRSTSTATLLNSQINAAVNGAAFVPYLTSDIYTMLAKAFSQDAAKYENDYMHLSTQEVLTAENIAIAKTMVNNAQSEIDFVNSLLAQANENYKNAVSASNKAHVNLSKQQIKVSNVGAKFEQIGIPDYEREQIIKAVITLVSAVVTFGAGIAMVAAGDPAAAPAAVTGAVDSAKAVAAAADTAKDIAKTAKILSDSMASLKKLVEVLKKVYELAKAVKEVAGNISEAKKQMKAIQDMDDTTGGADLSAADGWEVYKIQADNILEDPIKKEIGFAAEYKQELDIMVIYGQSLSASQLAVIKAGQEVASITFQLYYAKEKKANLEKLVSDLKVGDTLLLETMQQFYQKYLDSKSSLFSALKSYQASYFYWALRNSSVQPKIIDPVKNLNAGIEDITKIAMDNANALNQFNPPPQSMSNMLFEIKAASVLKELQTTGKTTWVLPLDNPEFEGLNRVRLSKIRVWLEGIILEPNHDSVFINITTAGNYLDRYNDLNYQFGSKELTRTFKYMVSKHDKNSDWDFDNDTFGVVQIDGSVDREVKYAYFQPTPFSEWSISLTSNNKGVDYSKISKITMVFEGSAIGSAKSALVRKKLSND